MIVVAVEDFDVDASVRYASGELAELARLVLIQALHKDLVDAEHLNARGFERVACGVAILEQEMLHTASVDHPRSAAFDAHARAAERVAHSG